MRYVINSPSNQLEAMRQQLEQQQRIKYREKTADEVENYKQYCAPMMTTKTRKERQANGAKTLRKLAVEQSTTK